MNFFLLSRYCVFPLTSFSRIPLRYITTLLCVEHADGRVNHSTNHALTASLMIGGSVVCLIAGDNTKNVNLVAQSISKFDGVSEVLVATNDIYKYPLVEPITDLIVSLQKKYIFSHISMSASTFGKNVIPRVAGKLDVAPITDIVGIKSHETFVRTIYASNAISSVTSNDFLKVFTVRSTAFTAAIQQENCAPIQEIKSLNQLPLSEWMSHTVSLSERPELSSAKIVISGGRGLKSEENFALLYNLADKIGAAVGASRAAVDAGYVPNELQIGQTGKIVAPQLYIAVGISGAIQHLAGMKDSKTIVAINKDPDAPIFQIADYGLVADLFNVIPELSSML